MNSRIAVQHAADTPGIPPDAELTAWAERVLAQVEAPQGELCLRITDAAEIRQLNHQYRDRDRATNVLSFTGDPASGWLGDIVLCAEIIAAEAKEQQKPPQDHWAHLVVHGVLHILGYDHENPEQADVMEALEQRLLASANIPDPYTTREPDPRRATRP